MTYKTVVVCPWLPKDKEIPNQSSSVLHGQGAGFSLKFPSPLWRSKYPTLIPLSARDILRVSRWFRWLLLSGKVPGGSRHTTHHLVLFSVFLDLKCSHLHFARACRPGPHLYLFSSSTCPNVSARYIYSLGTKKGKVPLYCSCLTLCLKSVGFLCIYFCSRARGR